MNRAVRGERTEGFAGSLHWEESTETVRVVCASVAAETMIGQAHLRPMWNYSQLVVKPCSGGGKAPEKKE